MRKGSKHSAETIERIRAGNRGKEISDEDRAKKRAAITGRIHTAETRAKIGAVQKGRKASNATRAKMRATARRGPDNHRWTPTPSYSAAHQRLRRSWPKTGVCGVCKSTGRKTHWAWRHPATAPGGWSSRREDYMEMCVPCHRRHDYAALPGPKRGTPKKLCESDVWEIRARLANGELQKEIASDYDVGVMAISNIKTGATWRWLP